MGTQIVTAPRASTLIYGLTKGGPKGTWLLPANVCPAIPLALVQAKTSFEFIDIDPLTLCMNIGLAKQRIDNITRSNIAGIIYVRSYGFSLTGDQDLLRLRAILERETMLVDDQCLCTPVVDWENRQSNGANAVIFSTGYGKMIDLGSGGYGVFFGAVRYDPPTIQPKLDAFNSIMKIYKMAIKEGFPIFSDPEKVAALPPWVSGSDGPDWKDLKTSILANQAHILVQKAQINTIYREGLADFNPLKDGYQHWRFNIRVKNSTAVLAALFDAGLFASDHYYPSSMLWGYRSAPNTLALHKAIINLFNDRHFSVKQAKQAVDIIRHVAIKDNLEST